MTSSSRRISGIVEHSLKQIYSHSYMIGLGHEISQKCYRITHGHEYWEPSIAVADYCSLTPYYNVVTS